MEKGYQVGRRTASHIGTLPWKSGGTLTWKLTGTLWRKSAGTLKWKFGIESNSNSMLAKIIRLCQPDRILLLTGTPSYFNQRRGQYEVHSLSYEDIPNNPSRAFSKVAMDLVQVDDRNNIEDCLRIFFHSAKQKRYDLSQMAVIARSVNEAETVKQLLERHYRLRCLISTSQHDSDSSNLQAFKSGQHQCIITVNRIIAGWSYNNLTCVLDLAASQQINRSFQLLS
jgi:hypothetical protein